VGGDDESRSPRERYLTVCGRAPVTEVLNDLSLTVDRVFVAMDIAGTMARQITALAEARGVEVQRVPRERVTRISGTGKQHQGLAADVVAPKRRSLPDWVADMAGRGVVTCLLLDNITTPANVGMIIRSATGAGLDGIVIPSRGVADLGSLVIKASAGVAFRAPLLRVRTAVDAAEQLVAAGFDLVALDAEGATDLWRMELGPRTAFVLGGEHAGVSEEVMQLVSRTVRIPMAEGVESLNVSAAAAVLSFELRRRQSGD
jgi:23S rRNA (guanosine2251-2'-O)-methyltransferase